MSLAWLDLIERAAAACTRLRRAALHAAFLRKETCNELATHGNDLLASLIYRLAITLDRRIDLKRVSL